MPELDDTDALLKRYATPKPDLTQVIKGLEAKGWLAGGPEKENWNTDVAVWWFDVCYKPDEKRTQHDLTKDLRDLGVWEARLWPHNYGCGFTVRVPRGTAYVKKRARYPGTKLGFDIKVESVVDPLPGADDPDSDIYLTDLDKLGIQWNKMTRAAMDTGWTLRKVIGKPVYKHVYLRGDGDTRWWMYVQYDQLHNQFEVWFDGQKLFQDDRGEDYWEDFEIEAGLELKPTDDFVAAFEGFALDEGPDEPTINAPDDDDRRDESAASLVDRLLEADPPVPSEDDPDLVVPHYTASHDIRQVIIGLRRKGWDAVAPPWKENWEHAEDAVWVFSVNVDFPNARDVQAKLQQDMAQLTGINTKVSISPLRDCFWVRVPRKKAFYSWRRGKMESKNI